MGSIVTRAGGCGVFLPSALPWWCIFLVSLVFLALLRALAVPGQRAGRNLGFGNLRAAIAPKMTMYNTCLSTCYELVPPFTTKLLAQPTAA